MIRGGPAAVVMAFAAVAADPAHAGVGMSPRRGGGSLAESPATR